MCSGVCGAAVIWLASFVDVDATPSNRGDDPRGGRDAAARGVILGQHSQMRSVCPPRNLLMMSHARTGRSFLGSGMALNLLIFARTLWLSPPQKPFWIAACLIRVPRRPRTFVVLIHKKIAAAVSGWDPIGMPSPFSGNLHQMHGGGGGLRDTISR